MEKAKDYIQNLKQRIEDKKSNLDNTFAKYQGLMSLSDSEIRTLNSNDSVLKNDPVYNSENASYDLKEAIKTRKLNGMTQEEFLDNYKAVLNGINLNKTSETGLAKITQTSDLDKIPTKIPMEILMQTNSTEKYLLRKCQEYGITERELPDLILFQKDYSTKDSNIFKWMEENYSLTGVGNLLRIRQDIADSFAPNPTTRPSVLKLIKFVERFGFDLDQSNEDEFVSMHLERAYDEIGRRLSNGRIDTPINVIIAAADAIPTNDFDIALDKWVVNYEKRHSNDEFVKSNNPSIVGKTSLYDDED